MEQFPLEHLQEMSLKEYAGETSGKTFIDWMRSDIASNERIKAVSAGVFGVAWKNP